MAKTMTKKVRRRKKAWKNEAKARAAQTVSDETQNDAARIHARSPATPTPTNSIYRSSNDPTIRPEPHALRFSPRASHPQESLP